MTSGDPVQIARLSAVQAAERLGVSASYLAQQRRNPDGSGPAFYQIGRKIEYAVADLDEWLAARRRTVTARLGCVTRRQNKSRDQQASAA